MKWILNQERQGEGLLIRTPEKGAIPTLTTFQAVAVHRMPGTPKIHPPVAAGRLNFGMTVHGLFIGFLLMDAVPCSGLSPASSL